MPDYIVTHSGSAHFDEVCAVALLLGEYGPCEIYRRKPTNREIGATSVCVVDTGGVYKPSKLDFDHHGSDLPDASSMILVMRYIGIEEEMRQAFDWVEFKDVLDRKGVDAAAESVGVQGDVRALQSPIEGFALHEFQNSPVPIECMDLLKRWGQNMLERARSFQEIMNRYIRRGHVERVGNSVVFFLPEERADSHAVRKLRERLIEQEGIPIHATVTASREEGKLSVFRFDEYDLDFTHAQGEDGVSFVHETGFLAVVDTVDKAKEVIRNG